MKIFSPQWFSSISSDTFKFFIICFSLVTAVIVRYPYLASQDTFPLGDGGLFAEMTYTIKSNEYFLPEFVNYNSHEIPFAYPPLGFYLALFSSKIMGISVLQVMHFLPLILNLFTIACFGLLASELVKDNIELFVSAGIFSLVFQVYQWTAKGGGLSRSPGFLFTVLTLYCLLLYQKRAKKHYLIFAAFCLGLTAMSHLEWALIACALGFILTLPFGLGQIRNRVFDFIFLGVGATLTSMFWWGTVLYRFGMDPFINAWNVAETSTDQFINKFLVGSVFSINAISSNDSLLPVFALLGFIVSIFRRELLIPFWLLGSYIVAPKNSPISGLVPLIILIATGLREIDRIVLGLLSKIKLASGSTWFSIVNGLKKIPLSIVYLVFLMAIALPRLVNKPMLRPIGQNERNAMEYIAQNTPKESSFVVLTSSEWHSADAAEWFPYLTQRQSLTTPQGLEWISPHEFNHIIQLTTELSSLVRTEQNGIESVRLIDYVESHFSNYQFVAVFANNIEKEFGGFWDSGRYDLFYRKSGVLIFRLIEE